MELPEIENIAIDYAKINPIENIIDATPEGYALRILRHYRALCDMRFLHGFDKKTRLIYEEMNRHQELRAKELDKAIARLEGK